MDLDVFNKESIKGYRMRMSLLRPNHVWGALDNEEFLLCIGAIGIGKDGKKHPTSAGLLMFGNEYCNERNPAKLKKEYVDLIEQLFSRNYNKSLYKSLAEFELVYGSFTVEQKLEALKKLQAQTDSLKPFLGDKKKKNYLAGYLKSEAVVEINEKIKEIVETAGGYTQEINLSQVVYVVTEFKQKMLNPNNVYLDMVDEILPISQMPLLSKNHIANKGAKEKYFYLYYKDDNTEMSPEKTRLIKEAIAKYLSN